MGWMLANREPGRGQSAEGRGQKCPPTDGVMLCFCPLRSALCALNRQPIRELHQKHVIRRRVRKRREVAAELEVSLGDDVGSVFAPDDVHGGAGTELPAGYGAAADAAEVEVGVAEGDGVDAGRAVGVFGGVVAEGVEGRELV